MPDPWKNKGLARETRDGGVREGGWEGMEG